MGCFRICKATMEVIKDKNGIDQVILRSPRGASVRVSLYGGQVTSWRNERGEELLFSRSNGNCKSPKAMDDDYLPFCFPQCTGEFGRSLLRGNAIRKLFAFVPFSFLIKNEQAICKSPIAIEGGIPICFPQFGNCGSAEQNGFVRSKIWTIDENPPPLHPKDSQGKSFVDLLLKSSDEDLRCWPHSFEFRLRVSLAKDGKLNLLSRIRNIGEKPFSFSFAYHTYLAVSDISDVRIEGLETRDYLDNLIERERFTEQGDAITFESELDRVYLKTPRVVAVLDHLRRRTFLIRKEGLPDVVVWNPWEKKAKSLLDFGSTEYKHMVCVNAAAVKKPIILKSGEQWKGSLELMVIPSSLCSEGLLFA